MKSLAVAVLTVTLATTGLAQAQTKAPAKPAAKSAAAAKKPAPRQAAAKAPAKKVAAARPAAAAAAVAVATPARALNETELALARHVHTGTISCELSKNVTVTADDKHPGFFHVSTGKLRYHMHPVVSQTGAMRMEDANGEAVWLQLGNKSMLMDQKLGKRVADGCAAPLQLEFAKRMQTQPATSLLGLAQN